MNIICNIPDDLEKKVDYFFLTEVNEGMKFENILSGSFPDMNDENSLQVFPVPEDSAINSKQKVSKSGTRWSHDFNFDVFPNSKINFTTLDKYTNKKIALLVYTSTNRYFIGSFDQPLQFSFNENTEKFTVTISGETYFSAIRADL